MDTKNIVVFGGTESGCGAAILAKTLGNNVFVSADKPIPEPFHSRLRAYNIPFEEGEHSLLDILKADIIIKTPGMKPDNPIIQACLEASIPIIGEIEYAIQTRPDADYIAITGTNGKTTTTLLTHHLLLHSGIDTTLAGNVGYSIAYQYAQNDYHNTTVLELSSYQLDTMPTAHIHIGALLNITPDHLDRYKTVDNYALSKIQITKNMNENDVFIYNDDCEITRDIVSKTAIKAYKLPFSMHKKEYEYGAYKDNNTLIFKLPNGVYTTIDTTKTALQGKHNEQNMMAAGLIYLAYDGNIERLQSGMDSFINAPHRLEMCGAIDGVPYINDSKATNIDSVWYALDTVHSPIILILGGVDKGNNYDVIMDLVHQKVSHIICMGTDNTPIIAYFKDKNIPLYDMHTFEDAMDTARKIAYKGSTVLLSPACASFDLFNNYEHRGDVFRDWVHKHSTT